VFGYNHTGLDIAWMPPDRKWWTSGLPEHMGARASARERPDPAIRGQSIANRKETKRAELDDDEKKEDKKDEKQKAEEEGTRRCGRPLVDEELAGNRG
jgi:hypothetical protein